MSEFFLPDGTGENFREQTVPPPLRYSVKFIPNAQRTD